MCVSVAVSSVSSAAVFLLLTVLEVADVRAVTVCVSVCLCDVCLCISVVSLCVCKSMCVVCACVCCV